MKSFKPWARSNEKRLNCWRETTAGQVKASRTMDDSKVVISRVNEKGIREWYENFNTWKRGKATGKVFWERIKSFQQAWMLDNSGTFYPAIWVCIHVHHLTAKFKYFTFNTSDFSFSTFLQNERQSKRTRREEKLTKKSFSPHSIVCLRVEENSLQIAGTYMMLLGRER